MPAARSLAALTCATLTVLLLAVTLASGPRPAAAVVVSPTPISFKMSVGGSKVTFSRKKMTKNAVEFLEMKLQTVVVTSQSSGGAKAGRAKFDVFVATKGIDTATAALLYSVGSVGLGHAAALTALQALGDDPGIASENSTDCLSVLPAQTCSDLATQLAESLDAALALGDGAERGVFLSGLQALGFTTCQNATSTTTTTTTSTTTSTTVCSAGLTNCSGTCVNLMTDNNNCGSCGNVCTTLPVCIGGVCTIP
jgi:hypothetical protein